MSPRALDKDSVARSLDEMDLDALDDFDSEDPDEDQAETYDEAAARGRNAYIAGMWSKYGFTEGVEDSERILMAHKMVQNFVDTFSTDGPYRVTFDPSVSTAGTDLIGRKVVITPAPLFDKNLTLEDAALVLTGMATHEISHPRYGRATALACRRIFGNKRGPNTLSNLLDDVRIERRFAAEYPGYADVFLPMIDYVGRADRKRGAPAPSMTDLINLAILAIRFERHVAWPAGEVSDERDWWQDWATRGAREDAPRRHVEFVRDGLKHIVYEQVKRQRKAANAAPLVTGDLKRIKTTLDGLPPMARKAMRLSSQGVDGAGIAATLGISLDQAKILVREARKKMAGLA